MRWQGELFSKVDDTDAKGSSTKLENNVRTHEKGDVFGRVWGQLCVRMMIEHITYIVIHVYFN